MRIDVALRHNTIQMKDINFTIDILSLKFKNNLKYIEKRMRLVHKKIIKDAKHILYPFYQNGTLTQDNIKTIVEGFKLYYRFGKA
jgi:hypothetical protein